MWKYQLLADEVYPLQVELIDTNMITTLSAVQKGLKAALEKLKRQHKKQVARHVTVKFLDIVNQKNRVHQAFKTWKNDVFEIRQRQAEIEESLQEKNALVEQHSKLTADLALVKQARVQAINDTCPQCYALRLQRLDEISDITINKELYHQLYTLVGQRGLKELLGNAADGKIDLDESSVLHRDASWISAANESSTS